MEYNRIEDLDDSDSTSFPEVNLIEEQTEILK